MGDVLHRPVLSSIRRLCRRFKYLIHFYGVIIRPGSYARHTVVAPLVWIDIAAFTIAAFAANLILVQYATLLFHPTPPMLLYYIANPSNLQ
jgi:hypothetical protein